MRLRFRQVRMPYPPYVIPCEKEGYGESVDLDLQDGEEFAGILTGLEEMAFIIAKREPAPMRPPRHSYKVAAKKSEVKDNL